MKKKKVMLFGTFDILHPGHEYVFSQAKNYGDCVMVVLARDVTVKKVKGRLPHYDEITRQKNLQKSGWVDEVVLGEFDDKYLAIKKHRPDVVLLGYDQDVFVEGLETLVFNELLDIEIRRLDAHRPDEYKSSMLREKI